MWIFFFTCQERVFNLFFCKHFFCMRIFVRVCVFVKVCVWTRAKPCTDNSSLSITRHLDNWSFSIVKKKEKNNNEGECVIMGQFLNAACRPLAFICLPRLSLLCLPFLFVRWAASCCRDDYEEGYYGMGDYASLCKSARWWWMVRGRLRATRTTSAAVTNRLGDGGVVCLKSPLWQNDF